MSLDQRLFDYPLESQLQRLRWRLDDELGALARGVAALSRARAANEAIDIDIRQAARLTTPAPDGRIDLARARHAIEFLALLQQRRARLMAELGRCEADVAQRRDALAGTQRDLERLENDRDDRLAEHLRDVDRRQSRESDQDWTARAFWRDALLAREEFSS